MKTKYIALLLGFFLFSYPLFGHGVLTDHQPTETQQSASDGTPQIDPIEQIYINLERDIWSQWIVDPSLFVSILLALLYGINLSKKSKSFNKRFLPATISFYLSLVVIFISLCSPIAYLADLNFSAHMFEHLLLMNIAAPLFVAGRPFPFLWRGLPKAALPAVVAASKNRFIRNSVLFFFRPINALLLFIVNLLVWHIPYFHNWTIVNELVHYTQHILFFIFGVTFWWNVIDPSARKKSLQGFTLLPYIVVPMVIGGALAAMITFADFTLYAYPQYSSFGLTPLDHQQFGGALMWVLGSMTYLACMLWLFSRSYAESVNNTAISQQSQNSL